MLGAGIDIAKDLCDFTALIDDESAADNALILFAEVLFKPPSAEFACSYVACDAQKRVFELEFVDKFAM